MNTNLKIMLFNLENFFLPPFYTQREFENPLPKNIEKIKKIAKLILTHSPDLIMLTEIGGEDSLNNFNKKFLSELYHVSLIEGNSDRGIELGYLLKKDLPFQYDHLTHKNRALDFMYPDEVHLKDKTIHFLSRDIAELRVYKDKPTQKFPSMIFLLVHLKSKLDSQNRDVLGIKRREAEMDLVLKTYNHLNERYNSKVPIILAGDFNGNAAIDDTDIEFKNIYRDTNLQDFMELAAVPHEERFSYVHFLDHYSPNRQQLDYIFISSKYQKNVKQKFSGVYRFHDNDGTVLPIPTNRSLMYTLPSDHYPLFLELENII